METFFTADLHFNHANIIKYCNRRFDDVSKMNNALIKNWNKVVSPRDMVYHIGDFCFKKTSNNGYKGKEYWESQLNGNIVFLSGNHDKYIELKSIIIQLPNGFALLRHYPIYNEDDIPKDIKMVLCGHVHDKWKTKHLGDIKVINVGTDVWKFKPVELSELVECS